MGNNNMSKKHKVIADVAVGILLASLIFSLIMFSLKKIQPRQVYYFHSFDTKETSKVCTEVRRFNNKSSAAGNMENRSALECSVERFIEDLLLGPMTNRYKYLFNPKTTLEFCFIQNKILNVGLSSQALKVSSEYNSQYDNLEEGVRLLKVNIVKNFTNINKINVYIDGVSIYEE